MRPLLSTVSRSTQHAQRDASDRPTSPQSQAINNTAPVQILDDVEERIRRFAEEASSLEGFQVLCDPWSPWSGIAAACTAALADDYPNQPRLLLSCRAPLSPDDALMHELAATGALSGALATAHWMASGTIMVPVEAPAATRPQKHTDIDWSRPFHTSAAAAAALDSSSLPWRMAAAGAAGPPSQGATTMAAWAAGLTPRGANIVATGGILPAVSVPFTSAVLTDERLSARERRLRGLPVEPQPAVPAALVNGRLQWSLGGTAGVNPLDSALQLSCICRLWLPHLCDARCGGAGAVGLHACS